MLIDQLPFLEEPVADDEVPVERETTLYKTKISKLFKNVLSSLGITGAQVGQSVVIKTVDATGAPTAYDTANLAPIESPTFTGTPLAPTAAAGTANTQIATTAFVNTALANFAPLVRPNLLDNWYFVGGGSQLGNGTFPINHKGLSTYNSNAAMDRWTVANGKVYIPAGYINMDQGASLIQILDSGLKTRLNGKQITISVLAGDNSLSQGTVTYNRQAEQATVVFNVANRWAAVINTEGNIRFDSTNYYATVRAVKLELGSDQTLAHQENGVWVLNEIPDWNVERYKCDPTIGSNLATIETSPTSQAHALYENIVYNGKLYQVIAAMGPNETLRPGTNIIERKAVPEIFTYTSAAKTVSPGGNEPTWFFYNEQFPVKGNYLIIGYVWSNLTANVMFQCRLFTDNLTNNYIKNDPVMYNGVTVQSVGFGTTNFSLGTFLNDVTITGQSFGTSITARAKAVVIKL